MRISPFNLIILALVMLASGDAYSDSTIYACAHKNSGDLRIISAPGQCLPSEYEVSWSSGDQSQQRINELLGRVAAIEAALGVINEAPVLSAGQDETILVSMTFSPTATATDDGLIRPLSFLWEKVSGVGAVNFTAATSLTTSVSVTSAGIYVLRLSVSDGAVTVSDELQLTVYPDNTPPIITMPPSPLVIPARWINLGGRWSMQCLDARLGASANDDGLPLPSLSYNWEVGNVRPLIGGTPSQIELSASFSSADPSSPDWPLNLVARSRSSSSDPRVFLPLVVEATTLLSVSDGYHSVEDSLSVQCDVRASDVPQVDAGPVLTQEGIAIDLRGSYRCEFNLNGFAEDDGLPLPLAVTWTHGFPSPSPSGAWTYQAIFSNFQSPQTIFSMRISSVISFGSPSRVEFPVALSATDGYSTAVDSAAVVCIRPTP